MKTNSFYDTRGALWVACTECKRGYNGYQSCTGAIFTKFAGQGCFCGDLLEKHTKLLEKQQKQKESK